MNGAFDKVGPIGAAIGMATTLAKLLSSWSNEKIARQNIEIIFTGFILNSKTGKPRRDRMDFTEAQLRFVTTILHVEGGGSIYYVEISRTDLPGTDRKRTRGFFYGATLKKIRYR
jgi:hypothetical protein